MPQLLCTADPRVSCATTDENHYNMLARTKMVEVTHVRTTLAAFTRLAQTLVYDVYWPLY